MRDAFSDRIIAQALFKNRQRERLLAAFPDLYLVWVRSTPALTAVMRKLVLLLNQLLEKPDLTLA